MKLKGFFPEKRGKNALLEPVKDTEPLARYLLSKKMYSRKNERVKPSAFMPPSNLRLSVFRTQNLTEKDIWKTGEEEVINKLSTPKTLYGRADLFSSGVRKLGLELDPDISPSKHVNIIKWPQEKSEQKLKAIELAAEATLKLVKE